MKLRTTKIIIDVSMLLGLVVLFGLNIIGSVAHEIIGIICFALFITHNVLNCRWYKTLFKGKYKAYRVAQLIINVLLLFSMLGTMVTGILISKEVFKLNLDIDAVVYNIHKSLGYYGLILASIHLGMHMNQIIGRINKTWIKCIVYALFLVFFGLMIFSMIDLKIYEYLFFQAGFRFYEDNLVKFYLEIISFVMGFAGIGLGIFKLTQIKRRKSDGI